MVVLQTDSLCDLYEQDETAWLKIMAKLAARKQFAAMDIKHLSEFLSDMANAIAARSTAGSSS